MKAKDKQKVKAILDSYQCDRSLWVSTLQDVHVEFIYLHEDAIEDVG